MVENRVSQHVYLFRKWQILKKTAEEAENHRFPLFHEQFLHMYVELPNEQ